MPIYDDFSAPALDTQLWTALAPSVGFINAALKVELRQNECRLSVEPAKNGSAPIQPVMLSMRSWDVGREPLQFSTVISADADAEGPACAAFGIFEANGGTVLGIAATGTRLFAVARESGDPLAPLQKGALEFTDLGVVTLPMRRHDVKIEYDPQRRIARWYVDEVMQLYREVPFDPRVLTCAFGVLPLRAIEAGDEARISAAWGPIQYSDEGELEPDPFLSAMPG
jgi:hypothetical protein